MRVQSFSTAIFANQEKAKSQNVSANKGMKNAPAFGAGFVTVSQKNLGADIVTNIISPFNSHILPAMLKRANERATAVIQAARELLNPNDVIKTRKDLADKVNFFVLAAGSGSRFHELASSVGHHNKISLPIHLENGQRFQMLDVPMAMGRFFLGTEGYGTIMAEKKSGSLGDIVKHYLENPKDIKDTVVCCGDNIFGTRAGELTSFFTKAINSPNTHLALVGVEREPIEVVKKFGVLGVEKIEHGSEDVRKLTVFKEKPKTLEEALQYATPEGKNIANTGMFYFSKEAMGKLIEEIKQAPGQILEAIAKPELEKGTDKQLRDAHGVLITDEPYDFGLANEYILKKIPEWFGIKSKEGASVKIVKKWEDVGEPKAYYRMLEDMEKHGTYLDNLPDEYAQGVRKAIKDKTVHGDKQLDTLLFSKTISSIKELENTPLNVLTEVRTVENIDGTRIIVAEKQSK